MKKQASIPSLIEKEMTKALADWVHSLPVQEARKESIFFCGTSYTPLRLLNEVRQKSTFGIEFLTGLYYLNNEMIQENPDSSIADLIRSSIGPMTS